MIPLHTSVLACVSAQSEVVNAVFVQQTMKTASSDEELAFKQKERDVALYTRKVKKLFQSMDSSGDGSINKEEFAKLVNSPMLKFWMGQLELEYHDLMSLFEFLDNGDGEITLMEFIEGAARLRGGAKALDIWRIETKLEVLFAEVLGAVRGDKDVQHVFANSTYEHIKATDDRRRQSMSESNLPDLDEIRHACSSTPARSATSPNLNSPTSVAARLSAAPTAWHAARPSEPSLRLSSLLFAWEESAAQAMWGHSEALTDTGFPFMLRSVSEIGAAARVCVSGLLSIEKSGDILDLVLQRLFFCEQSCMARFAWHLGKHGEALGKHNFQHISVKVQKFAEKHSLSELARADLKKMFDGVVTKSRKRVTVRVPATTANMGPGFDCAGMALDVWNELTVERAPHFAMELLAKLDLKGAHLLPRDKSNLVVKGVEAAYKFIDQEVPTLRYYTLNRIPFAKGMGSSSAARHPQGRQL
eukprot:s1454_g11.t1